MGGLPEKFNFNNYIRVLKETNMLSYFKVSFIVTIISTALQLVLSAGTAYVLANYKFKNK